MIENGQIRSPRRGKQIARPMTCGLIVTDSLCGSIVTDSLQPYKAVLQRQRRRIGRPSDQELELSALSVF
jgi:hypothetical protein